MTPCVFCEINTGRAPATFVHEWSDAIAIVPLNPVVDGHTLVIPKTHVTDFADDLAVSAAAMRRAAQLAAESDQPMNLITSRGREATQSVFHLHLHLVPRAEGDGLSLPWDVLGAGVVRPDEETP
jgi:histidine triad (HIT) family protein